MNLIFADDVQETPTKSFLTKTAEWTDNNKNEVKITLESGNASETLANNILFIGSLCGNHSLVQSTVIDSLNTSTVKANVDYRLWYSPKTSIAYDPNAALANGVRHQFSGTIKKGEKITDKDQLYADLQTINGLKSPHRYIMTSLEESLIKHLMKQCFTQRKPALRTLFPPRKVLY